MNISIEYCMEWNYFPQASSLGVAIKEEFGISLKYIKSGGGVFEVVANGKLIFSKKATGRFPSNEEVIGKLKSVIWNAINR